MGRSNQYGAATLNGMYERDRLRRMAQKLGLRLIKSPGTRSKPQGQATHKPVLLESQAESTGVTYAINEQAS